MYLHYCISFSLRECIICYPFSIGDRGFYLYNRLGAFDIACLSFLLNLFFLLLSMYIRRSTFIEKKKNVLMSF